VGDVMGEERYGVEDRWKWEEEVVRESGKWVIPEGGGGGKQFGVGGGGGGSEMTRTCHDSGGARWGNLFSDPPPPPPFVKGRMSGGSGMDHTP
jgi:hypothetical protein